MATQLALAPKAPEQAGKAVEAVVAVFIRIGEGTRELKMFRQSFLAISACPASHCVRMCLVAIADGRPACTCEAHPTRQLRCHSRCVILSGPPVPASASRFLRDLCGASPPPVREPPSFHTRRKHHGDQQLIQTTSHHAAMRQHQSDDLAERQREGLVLRTTFFRPFKDQAGEWRNGTSFGLNDLEALMNVACEAKEWIAAHVLKR